MHKFRCPDGHEFEAKRNFYAHCPVCGKNAKRLYDAKDDPPPKEPEKSTDEKSETKETTETDDKKVQESQTSTETGNEREVRKSVRQVKVKRGTQAKKEDVRTDTKQSSTGTPAKKVKVRKGAAPKVTKKIVTTRDRKQNKEKKEEQATQWRRVSSFKLF